MIPARPPIHDVEKPRDLDAEWADAKIAARDAYRLWRNLPRADKSGRATAYASFQAALDQEEAAADALAKRGRS